MSQTEEEKKKDIQKDTVPSPPQQQEQEQEEPRQQPQQQQRVEVAPVSDYIPPQQIHNNNSSNSSNSKDKKEKAERQKEQRTKSSKAKSPRRPSEEEEEVKIEGTTTDASVVSVPNPNTTNIIDSAVPAVGVGAPLLLLLDTQSVTSSAANSIANSTATAAQSETAATIGSLGIENSSPISEENNNNNSNEINETFEEMPVATAVVSIITEEKKTCIQCGQTYTELENVDGACSFHTHIPFNRRFACCGVSSSNSSSSSADQQQGCKRSKHRNVHHNDYPYQRFFERSQNILNYVDTIEKWLDISPNSSERVTIGKLLKWQSRGPRVEDVDRLLLVRVGASVWPGSLYFFHVFHLDDILAISNNYHSNNNNNLSNDRILIAHTGQPSTSSSSENNNNNNNHPFSSAEWICSNGTIIGIRATTQDKNDHRPTIAEIKFSLTPSSSLAINGKMKWIQRGGIVERRCLHGSYHINSTQPISNVGDKSLLDLSMAKLPRSSIRDDLIETSNDSTIKLALGSKIRCNHLTFSNYDTFFLDLIIANTSPSIPFLAPTLSAEWRTLESGAGDKTWKKAEVKFSDLNYFHGEKKQEPLKVIAAPGSETACIQVQIPLNNNDSNNNNNNGDYWPVHGISKISKFTPLRLRITLRDITGNSFVSRVFEYIQPLPYFEKTMTFDPNNNNNKSNNNSNSNNNKFSAFLDDGSKLSRTSAEITIVANNRSNDLASFRGTGSSSYYSLTINKARSTVQKAMETNQTIMELWSLPEMGRGRAYSATFFGLIDINAQRIYALRAILIHKSSGVAKSIEAIVPFYGGVSEDENDYENYVVDSPTHHDDNNIGILPSSPDIVPECFISIPFEFEDDGMDDIIPPKKESSVQDTTNTTRTITKNQDDSSSSVAILERLDVIANNTDRIAKALEALVQIGIANK